MRRDRRYRPLGAARKLPTRRGLAARQSATADRVSECLPGPVPHGRYPGIGNGGASRNRLPTVALGVEITETGIMQDMHGAVQTLQALHRLGVGIAIDDFGTGHSSLSYLRRLPVDRLKIDRSFVLDVTSDEEAATVVRTIVQLAHNLHLEVVAEGVETQAHDDFVRNIGCTYAQGFFYGRPMKAAEMASLMLRQPEWELAQ